ncbi:ubiquitin carboxyl-terminal hydrolase 48 [Nilaparvata lugens]|uniref:ubiquitin carboxyl-terminal hydrolase 48 n=1 Tax=Nilaparvata lugens TaxID=108931 RepID=UPI00193CC667|nr:ubiquitin carboxyl-terminal hydrolase 48 [Nilaparvata lugens]
MGKFRKEQSKNAAKDVPVNLELIPESLDKLYRLAKLCKNAPCRRNCKSSPRCLSGLGEAQWLTELETIEDPKNQVRTPGAHVGLENLGATCYVNSLLQLWFHTPQFRRAIFDWDPLEDACEQTNPTVADYSLYQPISPIGQLQAVFSLMSCSKRCSLNPTQLIQSLGLDISTEQDAQEFSKLFLNLLETKLETQSLLHVKNLVCDNFKGEYSYVTRCSKCKTKSINPSQFFELELSVKGKKNLDESLTEYLKEEKLDGANCYSCAVCNKKQEAERFIEINRLPSILNLQLMRYVYDRQRGDMKKLNTAIQFPEILDMKKYVKDANEGQSVYKLTAVLAHRGLSADSGHYIAYIQDNESGDWYIFNDELVEKNTDGKRLNLDEDDKKNDKKKGTNSRVPKGFLCSTKAYMLVYRRVSDDNQSAEMSAPLSDRLQQYIIRHNKEFDDYIEETTRLRASCIELTEQMKTLYNSLAIPEHADWSVIDAISTNWITHWLKSGANNTNPIDNSNYVCSHGCLNPDEVTNVKYVHTLAADELYKKYSGGPRIKGEFICCKDCTNSKNRLLFLKNKLTDDAKEISNLLKSKMEDGDPGFWVDKECLKNWKARVELERNNAEVNSNRQVDNEKKESDSSTASPQQISDPASATENGSKKRSLTPSALRNIRKRQKREPDSNSDQVKDEKYADDERQSLAANLNSEEKTHAVGLQHLTDHKQKEDGGDNDDDDDDDDDDLPFNQRLICGHGNLSVDESIRRLVPVEVWQILIKYFPNCRTFAHDTIPCQRCQSLANADEAMKGRKRQAALSQKEQLNDLFFGRNRQLVPPGVYYIVSKHHFVEPWRTFLRKPDDENVITSLMTSMLLCPHKKLLYHPQIDSERLCILKENEWDTLKKFYSHDATIEYRPKGDGQFETDPEMCYPCLLERHEEEEKARLNFESANVYVQKVDSIKLPVAVAQPKGKKMKLDPEAQLQLIIEKSNSFVRRSSRRKKVRGEKAIPVSSSTLISDFKAAVSVETNIILIKFLH